MVLGVDPGARRISLGLKQVESNPWHELAEKYPIGTNITGKVRNLTEFGAFVEVEEGIDGLIHISDMSWSKRLKHPSEALKKGDTVEAMVLNIDAENQRLSLGLKQLQTDIWDEFFQQHHVGDTVEGKIVRMTNFGAFVELAEGIEGLIHVSEFDDSTQKGKDGKLDLAGRRDLPDEDHQADPDRAEDRPEHPRAEERRVPRRLGGVHRVDRAAGSDAGRSLQAPAVKVLGQAASFKVEVLAASRADSAPDVEAPGSRDAERPKGANHEYWQHDESGARRGSLAGFGPHEEAFGSHRRHGLQEHHRRAASRREDRAARVRQLPAAAPGAAQGAQSEDGGQGGRPAEEGARTSSRARN